MDILIREEQPSDYAVIMRLTEAAFRPMSFSSHTEQFVVDALRRADALTLSLVAEHAGEVIGHVAVSPVAISSGATGWYGLGPISVSPEYQKRGIGSMLMNAALADLKARGAAGCVLLGDPRYYARFGFVVSSTLRYPDAPAEHFQLVAFTDDVPTGTVAFHPAFDATE